MWQARLGSLKAQGAGFGDRVATSDQSCWTSGMQAPPTVPSWRSGTWQGDPQPGPPSSQSLGMCRGAGQMAPHTRLLAPWNPIAVRVAQSPRFCCFGVTFVFVNRWRQPLLTVACFGEVSEPDQQQAWVAWLTQKRSSSFPSLWRHCLC